MNLCYPKHDQRANGPALGKLKHAPRIQHKRVGFPLTREQVNGIIPLADIETLSTGRYVCVLISLGVPSWHSFRLATQVPAAHLQPQSIFRPGW